MASTLRRRETRLAYAMLLPPLLIVAAVVIFPVAANIWIAFKPIELADLRAPEPIFREGVTLDAEAGRLDVLYRMRNSSADNAIRAVTLDDALPAGTTLVAGDPRCAVTADRLACDLGDWDGGHRDRVEVTLAPPADMSAEAAAEALDASEPTIAGSAGNPMLTAGFTLDNFAKVIGQRDFWSVLWVTIAYTFFGTLGAMILGLFAAQLLNSSFRGRAILRGLFLFPYVSPVIAVAFTWVFFLDPFAGVVNALTVHYGVTDAPVNFLGARAVPIGLFGLTIDFPLALATVIAFEAWRYFPLSFLFILARLQALPADLYEAAEMDGATPFQKFRYITLPQLLGILLILFMLRFIWTFNKFDDIFLLTGGAAGTRTLTVNVYEQGFALADIGAGAAAAVITFVVLVVFMTAYFAFTPKQEGM
ncbi:MAG: sugar ABC transporter permease [Azospirillaceae bacterium]